MNKERKTKTTIARTPPDKSTARWEMSDEEIWGIEAYQVTLMNSHPNVKPRPWSPGVNRAAA